MFLSITKVFLILDQFMNPLTLLRLWSLCTDRITRRARMCLFFADVSDVGPLPLLLVTLFTNVLRIH